MKVLIIDYGMSNLGSVGRAVEECGGEPIISDNPSDLDVAERIILPGVGAFADGMANLNAAGWPSKLRERLVNTEIQLLGICLGMQLMATKGSCDLADFKWQYSANLSLPVPDSPVIRIGTSVCATFAALIKIILIGDVS